MTQADRQLILHRDYTEPVEDVWAAFTESERLGRWIGTYSGTGRPGGTVEFTVTGEVDAGGEVAAPVTVTIHECDAPHRLVVEIPEGDGRAWVVAVTLERAAGGTALQFEQRLAEGLGVEDVAAGWNWYLDRLGASLRGTPMPDWSAYAPGD
ncbi:SRPBCC domain-containing protein [Pseudonocardia sp.]|uniref:SRPBCC domain-containing protein n=1 Tax=Pseudonocardia sp. TaxID=60912 RepID=UPI003D13E6C1